MTAAPITPAPGAGAAGVSVRQVLEDALGEVWARAAYDHARNWQTEPGISAVFGCQRQVGYAYQGTEPTDAPAPPDHRWNRQAQLGSWLHDKILPLLADALGADVIEAEVTAGRGDDGEGGVLGHLDLAGIGGVVDLKSCSTARLSKVRLNGPPVDNRAQLNLYARGRREEGHDVQWVALVYVDRENGEHHIWTSRPDDDLADEGLVWFATARTTDPEWLPRGGRGPGIDLMCDDCVFRSRCWPDGHTTLLNEADDQEGGRSLAVESALAMYNNAAQRKASAEEDREFAAAILSGEPKGTYGAWRLRFQSSGRRLDQKEAVRLLEEHGIPVPRGEATMSPRVSAAPVPAEGQ